MTLAREKENRIIEGDELTDEYKTTLAANLRPRGTTTIQNMTILPTPPPPEFVVISALARNNGVGGKRANIMASPAQLQHSPAPGNGPPRATATILPQPR